MVGFGLKTSNFIAFIVVIGFLLSIVFGLIFTKSAENLLLFVLCFTFVFYIFGMISASFYMKYSKVEYTPIPVSIYEESFNRLKKEVDKGQLIIDDASDFANSLIEEDSEDSNEGRKIKDE